MLYRNMGLAVPMIYMVQHGGIYIAAGNIANYVTTVSYGVYTGTDCVYAGGGRTNSSAIVGGEIADQQLMQL